MDVNDKLIFIDKQIENHKLSHAFLLETNNIDACYRDVKKLVKKINCIEKYSDECSICNLCKLIDLNNLPSFITIRPDGMSIKREQVEDLEDKFSKKPVFSKYNIYAILNAEKMTESSENTILKFLEEPEDNIICFLITTNKNSILPTIVSRCQFTHVNYSSISESSEMTDLALKYLDQIKNDSSYLINKKNILTKYINREDINKFFSIIFDIQKKKLEDSFIDDNGQNNVFNTKKVISLTQKVLQLIKYNVNLELILDYYTIEMRRING